MEDDFQSLSKGVFVIPFSPSNNEAGPSRLKRPLQRVYDEAYDLYEQAYRAYENDRSEFQLEEITHWLDSLGQPKLLRSVSGVRRLPMGVIQNIAGDVSSKLYQCTERDYTLAPRDATDLSSALRNVVMGLMGDQAGTGKKSGKSPMDELDDWYSKQKKKPELLLHIQQAQSISPSVLSELIYIIAIHPNVKLRVLLSVSSTTLFLSSWSHVEPSLIDLTVIQSGKGNKKGGAVNAILNAGKGSARVPLTISDELADELRRMESMTGPGSAAALKALKWSLLHHSFNSPLVQISQDNPEHVQAIVAAVRQGKDDVPGRELLELQLHPDLISTMDPAPRLSILHALGQPDAFVPPPFLDRETTPTAATLPEAAQSPSTRKRRRKVQPSVSPPKVAAGAEMPAPDGGDLKELETMFSLWRSAGRSVNLWDWLEGFRDSVTHSEQQEAPIPPADIDEAPTSPETPKRSARRSKVDETVDEDVSEEKDGEDDVVDEDTQDRLHATFIRFCEKARMMGLVRARGGRTAKRADEVVKSINFI